MNETDLFRAFLSADPDRLHLAAHSHHPWPDVAREGHLAAWEEATRYADRKWERLFADVVPRAERHIARILGLTSAGSLAFAPNTHELVLRILSALPTHEGSPVSVLTTGSEFHSFERQLRRLEESGLAKATRIASEPFESFSDRFVEAARRDHHDLVFLSHVFFDSGYLVRDLPRIVSAIDDPSTFVVVDGYHSFCAVPIDFAPLASRAFFLAGGYKYAMSGEGVAFVHAPPGYAPRPIDTGWFASFAALEARSSEVAYPTSGARFYGATFDPSGLHRFVRVMDLLEARGLDVAVVDGHVKRIQAAFLSRLGDIPPLAAARLVVPSEAERGRFLTFEWPGAAEAFARLRDAGVVTDVRGDRLRLGFGLYHREEDVPTMVARIARALA